ncbi:hypothetical protein L2E82_40053 [Cichorium intybus]|uniref:Uncharacterized protein n=1 Tax=Cichorium intybus TaxID=13427 RepID=A0ACB9APB3_CICIN|nr:hypothetical protein L2E82_40053 [Cichorium intybus]
MTCTLRLIRNLEFSKSIYLGIAGWFDSGGDYRCANSRQDSGGSDDPNRCAENPEFRPGRRITGTISIFYDGNWKDDADTAKRDCSKDLGINSTSFRYVLCMSEALSQLLH